MSQELVQDWLLNPLLWVAVAVVVLTLELFVISGFSLAIGLAGIVVGVVMTWFVPSLEGGSMDAAGRMVLVAAAVWSLFSLVMIMVLKFWFLRSKGIEDPNEYDRGVGVETGDRKTAAVEVPGYENVLKDYKPRIE